MKLSIIVPVYNMAGEGKLNYCMDSLISQNLREFEIIAVDDASTDCSFQILQDYEKRYPALVRAVHSTENRKQGGARNLGMEYASGEWIGFMDSDDWASPDMYGKLLQKAQETGADVVGCQYQITYEHSMKPGKTVINHTADQTGILEEAKYRKLVLASGSMVIKIYKKAVIDRYGLRFPEGVFYEDNAAGPVWMLHFTHFELVDEPLYYYYQHEASTVHRITQTRCQNRMETACLLVNACKEQGVYETYLPEIEARFTQLYYVNTLFSYMIGIPVPKLSFLRELRRGILDRFPNFRQNPYYDQMYDREQKKMIDLHIRNVLLFAIYDKALRLYRKVRYGKKN